MNYGVLECKLKKMNPISKIGHKFHDKIYLPESVALELSFELACYLLAQGILPLLKE